MDLLSKCMMRIMMEVLPVLLVALRWIWEVILVLALLAAAEMIAGGGYGIPTQLIEAPPLRSQDDVNADGRSLISGLIDFLFTWGLSADWLVNLSSFRSAFCAFVVRYVPFVFFS